jgi:hypothetical protein
MFKGILVAAAVFPFLAEAAIVKIATCQIKGESTNEFVVLADAKVYQPQGPTGPLALIETKGLNIKPSDDLAKITGAVKLKGTRIHEILIAGGTVDLPAIYPSKRSKTATISLTITTDTSMTSGSSPVNSMVYTVDGETTIKALVCDDGRE